jgi:uncharacterized protein (DUF4415 family)
MAGSSAFSQTDYTKLDSHEIQPDEYDDLPEITDAEFAAATLIDGREDNGQQTDLVRIDADVVAKFRAQGADWRSRINETLRRAAGL